jgi:hypothetical protein
VLDDSATSLYLAVFASTFASQSKDVHPVPAQRSTWKPVSELELSLHERSICDGLLARATRLLGAAIGGAVVPTAVLEYADDPPVFRAMTRCRSKSNRSARCSLSR